MAFRRGEALNRRGGLMHDYEIRIVTANGRASHVFTSSLPSDFAAIRRAHALVQPGQGVEVWRDENCIYANHHDHPMMVAPQAAGDTADYEIRILREDLKPSIIWKAAHENDRAAIRAGLQAASGHAVEVWRDVNCIFRAPASTPAA